MDLVLQTEDTGNARSCKRPPRGWGKSKVAGLAAAKCTVERPKCSVVRATTYVLRLEASLRCQDWEYVVLVGRELRSDQGVGDTRRRGFCRACLYASVHSLTHSMTGKSKPMVCI